MFFILIVLLGVNQSNQNYSCKNIIVLRCIYKKKLVKTAKLAEIIRKSFKTGGIYEPEAATASNSSSAETMASSNRGIQIGSAWFQRKINLRPQHRGVHLVTEEILRQMPELTQFSVGLCHVQILHTSASLALNESWDPDVRDDMEMMLNKIVPEGLPYRHSCEGPDDMPAHVKACFLGSSLTIPITDGKLSLGTWQGVWLCEHRDHAGSRKLVITLSGCPRDSARSPLSPVSPIASTSSQGRPRSARDSRQSRGSDNNDIISSKEISTKKIANKTVVTTTATLTTITKTSSTVTNTIKTTTAISSILAKDNTFIDKKIPAINYESSIATASSKTSAELNFNYSSNICMQPKSSMKDHPLNDNQTKRNDVHYLLKQLNSFSDIEEIEIVDLNEYYREQQQRKQQKRKEEKEQEISVSRSKKLQQQQKELQSCHIGDTLSIGDDVEHTNKTIITANAGSSNINTNINSSNDDRRHISSSIRGAPIIYNMTSRMSNDIIQTNLGNNSNMAVSSTSYSNSNSQLGDGETSYKTTSFFKCCYTSIDKWREKKSSGDGREASNSRSIYKGNHGTKNNGKGGGSNGNAV